LSFAKVLALTSRSQASNQLTVAANVVFLHAGSDLRAADLSFITWKEKDSLHAAITTSFTAKAFDHVPTISMLALGSTYLGSGASTIDDNMIKNAVDAMLHDLQVRVGQLTPALRSMPNRRMTAYQPIHYSLTGPLYAGYTYGTLVVSLDVVSIVPQS